MHIFLQEELYKNIEDRNARKLRTMSLTIGCVCSILWGQFKKKLLNIEDLIYDILRH